MKERPILFSAPMVRAILDDRKTQTRRLVTKSTSETGPKWSDLDLSDAFVDPGGTWLFGPGPYLKVKRPDDDTRHRVYPRYEVGGRLWVRETWRYEGGAVRYRADQNPETDGHKWTPSIYMVRRASRITLEIAGIRCERLHEITEADALAEGVLRTGGRANLPARDLFRELWDKINGKRAPWSANPWVWVLEFHRVEAERKAAE